MIKLSRRQQEKSNVECNQDECKKPKTYEQSDAEMKTNDGVNANLPVLRGNENWIKALEEECKPASENKNPWGVAEKSKINLVVVWLIDDAPDGFPRPPVVSETFSESGISVGKCERDLADAKHKTSEPVDREQRDQH
jgi:hypothetical protein